MYIVIGVVQIVSNTVTNGYSASDDQEGLELLHGMMGG